MKEVASIKRNSAAYVDWNKVFNGKAWQLKSPGDFIGHPHIIAQMARVYATRKGIKITIHMVDDRTLVIQAIPNGKKRAK